MLHCLTATAIPGERSLLQKGVWFKPDATKGFRVQASIAEGSGQSALQPLFKKGFKGPTVWGRVAPKGPAANNGLALRFRMKPRPRQHSPEVHASTLDSATQVSGIHHVSFLLNPV